jgi:Carboxypeptidase regulatory-like domain/TonB-dependent Receptor Plug Domain
MTPLRRAAAALLLLAAARPLSAQVLRGKVVDAVSGEPVPQVALSAIGADRKEAGHARTAGDGTFYLQFGGPVSVRLQTQRTGYRPTVTEELPVAPSETVYVEVRVSAAPLQIDPLRVTARVEPPRRRFLELNGFYHRQRVGFGAFLRREDIERLPHSNLAQVLQRTRGMAIHYKGAHQFIYFTRYGPPTIVSNVRGPPINACIPRVFLDGNRMTYDGLNDINSIVSPDQVEAIETYVAGNAPVEYTGSNSACGVILIWTRHEQ